MSSPKILPVESGKNRGRISTFRNRRHCVCAACRLFVFTSPPVLPVGEHALLTPTLGTLVGPSRLRMEGDTHGDRGRTVAKSDSDSDGSVSADSLDGYKYDRGGISSDSLEGRDVGSASGARSGSGSGSQRGSESESEIGENEFDRGWGFSPKARDDDGPCPVRPEVVLTIAHLVTARTYAERLLRDKVRNVTVRHPAAVLGPPHSHALALVIPTHLLCCADAFAGCDR